MNFNEIINRIMSACLDYYQKRDQHPNVLFISEDVLTSMKNSNPELFHAVCDEKDGKFFGMNLMTDVDGNMPNRISAGREITNDEDGINVELINDEK